jgi:hypothetical protein
MVIVNRGARASFLEKIYWYKAENEQIGMIGCKQFVEYHNNNYDPKWKKKSRTFDIMDMCKKKTTNTNTMKVEKVGVPDK